MPRHIEIRLLERAEDVVDVVVAVVVVDEPPLDPEPGVVHDPLSGESGLIADHGAHAHCVRLRPEGRWVGLRTEFGPGKGVVGSFALWPH